MFHPDADLGMDGVGGDDDGGDIGGGGGGWECDGDSGGDMAVEASASPEHKK